MSDEVSEIKYLDFEISVQQVAGDEYIVRAKSGEDKSEIRFTNPFNEDKRKVIKSALRAAALRSSSATRKPKMRNASAPEVREMKDFGALLFKEAVSGSVREFYQKCQARADRDQAGLRLRLTLDQSVDDMPWEFLVLNERFMALNPRSPVVRYIEGAASCSLVKVEYPLRVLVVIAKPSDEVPLDTDAEKESITAALKPLTDQGVVHLSFIEGNNTWKKLMRELLPNTTNILHFIGHGAFDEKNEEGVLIMADEDGKTELVDSERLSVLVEGRSRLALIVLNSCLGTQGGDAQPFSSVAAGLVRSGIPAVIAMQFEISDDAAREISETFYRSLTLNMPVDAALTEARRTIFLSNRNSLEWATPILYMQVPDGQLFEFKGARPTTVSEAQPVKPAIETNAAKHYAEGEEAMARGDLAAAVTAYRATMVYVPDYLDVAEKISICATRINAANQLEKGKGLIAAKEYSRALKALKEAVRLDKKLDVVELLETAECGEKYQRAVAELRRGKRNAGVDLLREVVSRKPSFEDASRRLEELAADGNGLLGESLSLTDSEETAEEQAGWKDRLFQLRTWITSTPEVSYEPPPGSEPEESADGADVFDRGRKLWNDWFPSKTSPAPRPKTTRQKTLHGTPQKQISPPSVRPVETPPEPPPVTVAQTPPPPSPDTAAETHPAPLPVKPAPRQPAPPPVTPQKRSSPPTPKTTRKVGGSEAIATPPARVFESRIYQTALNPKFLAEAIVQYFFSQRCEGQILARGYVWVAQGRKPESRQAADGGLAATVVIEQSFAKVRVSIGGGEWIAQGSSDTAGVDAAAALITGPIGLGNQEALTNILWDLVARFVAQTGGRPIG